VAWDFLETGPSRCCCRRCGTWKVTSTTRGTGSRRPRRPARRP